MSDQGSLRGRYGMQGNADVVEEVPQMVEVRPHHTAWGGGGVGGHTSGCGLLIVCEVCCSAGVLVRCSVHVD